MYADDLQNLSRVSSSGGSALGRQSSIVAKGPLAGKQLPHEPSAKFPVPVPKGGKISWRKDADPSEALPGTKPAAGKVAGLEAQKSVSASIGGRGKSGIPRVSKQ